MRPSSGSWHDGPHDRYQDPRGPLIPSPHQNPSSGTNVGRTRYTTPARPTLVDTLSDTSSPPNPIVNLRVERLPRRVPMHLGIPRWPRMRQQPRTVVHMTEPTPWLIRRRIFVRGVGMSAMFGPGDPGGCSRSYQAVSNSAAVNDELARARINESSNPNNSCSCSGTKTPTGKECDTPTACRPGTLLICPTT